MVAASERDVSTLGAALPTSDDTETHLLASVADVPIRRAHVL